MTTFNSETSLFSPLNHYGLIRFTGKDVHKFLQGLVTCDLNELSDQQSLLGAFCNLQGRVIAMFRIWQQEDAYFLLLAKDLISKILAHLKKYILRAQVVFDDVSAQYHIYGFTGEDPANQFSQQYMELPQHASAIKFKKNICAIKINNQQPRWLIISAEKLNADGNEISIQENEQIWQQANINAAFVEIQQATSELFTPASINFINAGGVSLKKGCYLGQEIIARLHYRGKSKEHLARVHLQTIKQDSTLSAGDILAIHSQTSERLFTLLIVATQDSEHYDALAVVHPIHNPERLQQLPLSLIKDNSATVELIAMENIE